MKASRSIFFFGALSLLFMGCPYESKFPVDDASAAKIDKSFATEWEEKGSDDYLWKVSLSGKEYRVEKKNTKDGGEPIVYNGFLSDVDGNLFLNVHEESESSDVKYYIYKVEKKGDDRFKLLAMTDNVTEEFTSSAELKTFIKKNMGISFFWNKDDEKTFYKH